MPLEELVHTVVVMIPISADREQIPHDGFGRLHAATLYGPQQRRDRLRTNSDLEDPHGSLVPRSCAESLPNLLGGVVVDGLHDQGGPLRNRPHQHPGDQPQRPAEGFTQLLILGDLAQAVQHGCDKGVEEVRGDAVAHVAQPQRGDIVHHAVRVAVHVQGQFQHPLHDEEQSTGGLLEEVLPRGGKLKKPLVDVSAVAGESVLRKVDYEPLEGFLLRSGLAELLCQQPLHVFPEPIPSYLVLRVPLFRHQGPQRGQHHRLELREVDLSLALRQVQGQHIAGLLKTIGVGHVGDDGVEVFQDELHPSTVGVPHNRGVEQEHLVKGCRHLEL
mmetsp:Transcript_46047/g.109452  ORF Transcript_46047/g.109452 Transcript_46047/m.109452 type:complete len:330 (-) Transcript_46047:818-1807(-)